MMTSTRTNQGQSHPGHAPAEGDQLDGKSNVSVPGGESSDVEGV